mmetsp:Transcript_46251/g.116470  ORF Transcript_46251/g.116470 Transcript_46251/m.116470 type:complete len:113 (+) Transcript_46251:56-394(+)
MSSPSEVTSRVLSKDFKTFEQFYPFYLAQHSNRTCRRLHVIGTSLGIVLLVWLLYSGAYHLLYTPFLVGYAFAWVGHFFFEKNRPATFKHPFYSFQGDFRLLYEVYTGKRAF